MFHLRNVSTIYQQCIEYVILPAPCPLEYTATRGRIQSPGYPGYWNHMRCDIIIHRQNADQIIFLKVEHFDLENEYDYLQIGVDERWHGTLSCGYNYTGIPP